MSVALDSTVLVASLTDREPYHAECDALVGSRDSAIYSHALIETFNTLTGSRLGFRLSPSIAARLITTSVVPFTRTIALSPAEILEVIDTAESRGVRGGAIYDYLHLMAARKAGAARFYTLNVSHFQAFHRPGDPEIVHP
jgi:predicted nucleic acid-binding protein